MLYTILIFLFVIVSGLMTISILMQSAKGGGLAASFGGAGGGGVLGPRGAANFLQKATTVLASLYLVLCLVIGFVGRPTTNTGSVIQQELQKQEATAQPAALPTAPIQTEPAQGGEETPPETPGN